MGSSMSQLQAGLSYLRQLRIYHFRERIQPGSTTQPVKPDLTPKQWDSMERLFQRDLDKTRSQLDQLPATVFTTTQSHVAAALLLMWDVMGKDIQSALYEDITLVIASGMTRVNGKTATRPPSRHTIATVLAVFEETGAAKYIRGWSGVRSVLTLVDLTWLREFKDRAAVRRITWRSGLKTAPPLRVSRVQFWKRRPPPDGSLLAGLKSAVLATTRSSVSCTPGRPLSRRRSSPSSSTASSPWQD